MGERLKNWIDCPLPREHWAGLDRDLVRTGYWPTLLVGVAVLVFEAGMMITTALRPGSLGASPSRMVYFSLYLFLFVATLVCMGLAIALRKRYDAQPKIFLRISIAYGFLICLWGSFISAYAHRLTADITVLIYTVLGVAIVVTMRPWQALILFLANLAFFYGFAFAFAPDGMDVYSSVTNSLIVTLLGVLISAILYRNKAGSYFNRVTIVQQNEKIRIINDQLRDLVLFDNLTGAYNRRYFGEVLPERMEDDRHAGLPLAVMMLDIDHFKQYNDIYGHPQGDVCLVTIADIVRSSTLSEEAAFIRYGGEEFLLYLAGADEERALEVAESIRRNIARTRIEHEGGPLGYVTISIGVATSGGEESTPLQELVQGADQALYAAKNAGRNRVVLFGPEY